MKYSLRWTPPLPGEQARQRKQKASCLQLNWSQGSIETTVSTTVRAAAAHCCRCGSTLQIARKTEHTLPVRCTSPACACPANVQTSASKTIVHDMHASHSKTQQPNACTADPSTTALHAQSCSTAVKRRCMMCQPCSHRGTSPHTIQCVDTILPMNKRCMLLKAPANGMLPPQGTAGMQHMAGSGTQ